MTAPHGGLPPGGDPAGLGFLPWHWYSSVIPAPKERSSGFGAVAPMPLVGAPHWSQGGWLTHLKKSCLNQRRSSRSRQ